MLFLNLTEVEPVEKSVKNFLHWQLAKYEGSGSYRNIVDVYNIAPEKKNGSNDFSIQSSPLSFVRGGWYSYSNGSLGEVGSGGLYWEGEVLNTTNAQYLSFWSTGLNPQRDSSKGHGWSIRCVVR